MSGKAIRFVLAAALAAVLGEGIALGQCSDCDGDFNDDGRVSINELVVAVGNSLDGCPEEGTTLGVCTECEGDFNGDGRVAINELVVAVGNALGGCSGGGFEIADGINGGLMYDKFWVAETGFDQADPNLPLITASSNFFRCKQCHAWDRLGNAASYINRGPKTTRPNVSNVDLATEVREHSPLELFDAIKSGDEAMRRPVDADLSNYDPADPSSTELGDRMPDFGEILTDAQIWDLVRYLKLEALDTTELYEITTQGVYPTGSRTFSDVGRDGDAANGDALYAAACAGCHGADGSGGAFPIEDGEVTVGSLVRNKPYEVWHKAKFGLPGSVMGPQGLNSVADVKDLYRALSDASKYPDPVGE